MELMSWAVVCRRYLVHVVAIECDAFLAESRETGCLGFTIDAVPPEKDIKVGSDVIGRGRDRYTRAEAVQHRGLALDWCASQHSPRMTGAVRGEAKRECSVVGCVWSSLIPTPSQTAYDRGSTA
jgi:hypothetical protein